MNDLTDEQKKILFERKRAARKAKKLLNSDERIKSISLGTSGSLQFEGSTTPQDKIEPLTPTQPPETTIKNVVTTNNPTLPIPSNNDSSSKISQAPVSTSPSCNHTDPSLDELFPKNQTLIDSTSINPTINIDSRSKTKVPSTEENSINYLEREDNGKEDDNDDDDGADGTPLSNANDFLKDQQSATKQLSMKQKLQHYSSILLAILLTIVDLDSPSIIGNMSVVLIFIIIHGGNTFKFNSVLIDTD
eukprot:TRINITY_DN2041_c0_g1_i2.p1 TRINITY_DN2041_c0_g1~~TRINITY_DN2041_c0_g1_i2.p1  ORF type:complete len:247 (-),score=53.91 TRINITY_DN2041_c0_g1_i2:270-1010(-)